MSPRSIIEANYDGLVGPTHNYAGLSFGNIASQSNKDSTANPKKAALQGLQKMRTLSERGIVQGVIPPLLRPDLTTLRRFGFSGSDAQVVEAAHKVAPQLLRAVYSVSSMWTANAATVVPAADANDGRTHFVPANLTATFHRSLEPGHTSTILQRLFPGNAFAHHAPLPGHPLFGDEGAANHTRLTSDEAALHLFVFGKSATIEGPKRYPARQSLEASAAVARLCRVEQNSLFLQQSPEAIDAGVFHNDVIAVGNENTLLYHEHAFEKREAIELLRGRLGGAFNPICVPNDALSVERCVKTYLFNSQLITLPTGRMLLVAPSECEQDPQVRSVVAGLVSDSSNSIDEVIYMDLRESMRNGGGPACLRLRVPLGEREREQLHQPVLFTPALEARLQSWVEKHYRETLSGDDLRDPGLIIEVQTALDELSALLALPGLYDAQA